MRKLISTWLTNQLLRWLIWLFGLVAITLTVIPELPIWWTELVANARLFYWFSGVAVGILLIIYQLVIRHLTKFDWLVYALALLLLAWPLRSFVPWLQTQTAPTAPSLRLMSANVHHRSANLALVLTGVKARQPDVLALIEMPIDLVNQLVDSLGPEYDVVMTQAGPASASAYALSMIAKTGLVQKATVTSYDGLTPVLDVELINPHLRLLVLHPPPPVTQLATAWRNQTLLTAAQIAANSSVPTLILGDLNISPFAPMFDRLLQLGKLTNPRQVSGVLATWPTSLPRFLQIPIDHILIPETVGLSNLQVGPNLGSDHLPISADIWRQSN